MISASQLQRLEKLAELRKSEVLTEQEFEQEKAKILAERATPLGSMLDRLSRNQ